MVGKIENFTAFCQKKKKFCIFSKKLKIFLHFVEKGETLLHLVKKNKQFSHLVEKKWVIYCNEISNLKQFLQLLAYQAKISHLGDKFAEIFAGSFITVNFIQCRRLSNLDLSNIR